MPITLVVREGPQSLDGPSLTVDGARIVIGRGDGCDVRLPDPSVSHRHATIRTQSADYVLVDEGSTNGSFLGGVRMNPGVPRALRNGDIMRIGRVWMEVKLDSAPATPDLAMATRDLAIALVSRAMQAMGSNSAPRLVVVEGPDSGARVVLEEEGRAYIMGRGEKCDLPLADEDASREHAQVVRRGGTVLVRDMGSRNGTSLGDAPVPTARDAPWKPNTMVRIGTSVIALEEPAAAALAELEAMADEPMEKAEVEEKPPPSSVAKKQKKADQAPEPGKAAPIVDVARHATTVPIRRRSRWSTTDAIVIGLGVIVIGLSCAGLWWLFRG